MTIKITLADDNDTSAPLYFKYDQQIQAQPAYLYFDPDQEELELEGEYSGEIGNSISVKVLNGELHRFKVPSNVSRDALEDLADDEKLESMLKELIAARDAEDYEKADDIESYIDRHCEMLETVDVWEAKNWVSAGFDLEEYEADPEKYVADAIEAAESEGVAIDGDIDDACEELAEEAREELED